jgi:hypothetical protein
MAKDSERHRIRFTGDGDLLQSNDMHALSTTLLLMRSYSPLPSRSHPLSQHHPKSCSRWPALWPAAASLAAAVLLSLSTALNSAAAQAAAGDARPAAETQFSYSRWRNGPPADAGYFPIAVWLQNPRNAARYKAAGINVYAAVWRGPTTNQLAELETAGMSLICSQNRVALANRDNPVIIGWMHGDEPDNAQSLSDGKGYGPPILPGKIIRDYERIRAADSTRPVMLNLGQGVAWDNYIGRGVRRNHPEDYAEYVKGCDIASFDIYPAVHDSPEIAGKLEFVARGVQRLVGWTGGEKIVWNCIECTHISNPPNKATPQQVRSEVWMALIYGSRGLIYFVHQFKPTFNEAALLDDPEMLAAVTSLNQQIHALAPALNSSSVQQGVTVKATGAAGDSPTSSSGAIAWMCKEQGGSVYLFTVNMRNQSGHGSFALARLTGDQQAEALGESRRVPVQNGAFADDFKPYEVHLYRISGPAKEAK